MPRKAPTTARRVKFANGRLQASDRGPQNPKLGNRAPGMNPPPRGGSGMLGGSEPADAYHQDPHPGKQLNGQPDSSINMGRLLLSVRMRFNPIARLTPQRLVGYLDQWRLGYFRLAGMTFEAMERRDSRIALVASKRKKSVARHGWEVLTVDNLPEEQRTLAEQQTDFLKDFYNNISVMTALEPDEQGGFALLIRQMMDAVGKRYAVHEIVWQPREDGSLTAKFIFCPVWWFEGTRGKLRFLDNEFQVFGRDLNPAEWLVTVHDGVMEACAIIYILKHLPLKSWVGFLDKFGTPGIHGKTDAPFGTTEWNNFVEAVKNFAEDWSAVTSGSGEITLVEAKNSGSGESNPFKAIVDYMDKELTLLWRGSDLGTSSGHNMRGASLQADETAILERDDAQLLGETLTNQVSRFALEWKFGPGCPMLAYLKIKTEERKDVAQDLAVTAGLVSMGYPITFATAAETFSLNLPDGTDGDELLTAPQDAQAGSGPNDEEKTGEPSNPDKEPGAADVANQAEPGPNTRTQVNRMLTAAGMRPLYRMGERRGARGVRAEVANEHPDIGPSAKYLSAAVEDLSKAVGPDLDQLNRRLAAVQDAADPQLRRQRAAEFLAWLAANEKHFSNNPGLEHVLSQILSGAVANGLALGRKST